MSLHRLLDFLDCCLPGLLSMWLPILLVYAISSRIAEQQTWRLLCIPCYVVANLVLFFSSNWFYSGPANPAIDILFTFGPGLAPALLPILLFKFIALSIRDDRSRPQTLTPPSHVPVLRDTGL